MKRHIQGFAAFSLNEGFDQGSESASDADLMEIGIEILEMRGNNDSMTVWSNRVIVGVAKKLLLEASPVPLTGQGERDVYAVADWIGATLTEAGIKLDTRGLQVSQDAFQNQVFVPFQGRNDLGITFNLDYSELVHQSGGREIQVPFSFRSADAGEIITVINPADNMRLMAAAMDFKRTYSI